jgi:uncharacterized membrane protein
VSLPEDRTILRARRAVALVIAAVSLLWAGVAPADGVSARPLPPLEGGISSLAHGINGRGEVVGYSSDGLATAVVWDRRGRPNALPPLAGDAQSEAFAINLRGEIAGVSRGGVSTAVVWNRADQPVALPPLEGDIESFARAINAKGEVAGFSIGRGPIGGAADGIVVTAVMWDRRGAPHALPPLEGHAESKALAINTKGEVAGFSYDLEGDDIAVLWAPRRGSRTPIALLPQAGDSGSEAHAIDRRGRIAGDSGGVRETTVLWSHEPRAWHSREREVAQTLPPLDGDTDSLAFAINGVGDVAGVSFGTETETAVAWDRKGSPKPLPGLPGDSASSARAINDAGQVAGFSAGDDRHTAVLWHARGRPRHGR